MKASLFRGIAAIATLLTFQLSAAQSDSESLDNVSVPDRAIVLSGGQNGVNRRVMSVLYDTSDTHFQDPEVPRFLFIDRKGTTVFGIGGYAEAVGQFDFHGAIDNNGFETNKIPIPSDPGLIDRLAADASHTNIVLQLLTHTRLGVLSAYVQANFTGDDGGYGFKLKQAYVKLHNVTAGLARSTFQDANAGSPTIDYQGPAGAISAKNLLLQYKVGVGKGFTIAMSAEMPKATYTTNPAADKAIAQRIPDIPAYVQYSWDGGKSHVRASAILRELSYRNLVTADNAFHTGWGVQLSGIIDAGGVAKLYYQAVYGQGISSYINDLSKCGYDLITDANGKMKAPAAFGFAAGLRFDFTPHFFMSATYSLSRLYGQESLGADAYRRGNYAVVNAFYTPINDLQIGLEYLHGRRTNMDLAHNTANRIEAMVKYSF